jgi:NADH-quinone oxidoreductase subunit L
MGALTAAFAATLSIVEKDIKRVIACLSLAQLGFMFVAAGVGSVSVAVSMLMLHGFVIALLLLGAGSVVQAMQHARNMMKYGGLRRRLPVTFVAMVAGTVVLTGVGLPLTSPGFGLRAVVIAEVWSAGELYGVWLLLVSAGLTAFAAWRMVFLTFAGTPRGDKHHCESVRESRALTLVPLGVLGIAVVVSGWSYVDPDQDDLPLWVLVYPFLSMLLGFLAAGMLYLWKTDIPARWAEARRPLYRFLRHGWHIDEICQVALVTFARKVGDFISDRVDIGAIERLPGRIAHGMAPREGQDRFGTLTAYAVAGGIGLGVMVIWAIAMGGGAP